MLRRWTVYDQRMKALIAAGGLHQDADGWRVHTVTGELIGPDPDLERPLSAAELLNHPPLRGGPCPTSTRASSASANSRGVHAPTFPPCGVRSGRPQAGRGANDWAARATNARSHSEGRGPARQSGPAPFAEREQLEQSGSFQ